MCAGMGPSDSDGLSHSLTGYYTAWADYVCRSWPGRCCKAPPSAAQSIMLCWLRPIIATVQVIDVLIILGQVMIQVEENINLKCLRLSDWTLSGMG